MIWSLIINKFEDNGKSHTFKNHIGEDSSSIIRNWTNMIIAFSQGVILSIILLTFRSKFITVPEGIKKNESSSPKNIENLEEKGWKTEFKRTNNQTELNSNANFFSKPQPKKKYVMLNRMIKDYKYEYYIRFGIQMYLDLCIYSLLNLTYFSFQNWVQVFSYWLSLVVLVSFISTQL